MAPRREIESLSSARQADRLARCVTEQELADAKNQLVRLGRLERPLDALSTHSLCQLGYRRMGDQGGFEPPTGLRHGIKSPVRSAATVTGPSDY
jgi:hypothetical protein